GTRSIRRARQRSAQAGLKVPRANWPRSRVTDGPWGEQVTVRTLPDLLLRRAEREPDAAADLLLDRPAPKGGPERMHRRQIGYGELDLAARRLAAWLLERGLGGQRVLVLQQQPDLFIASLFGCLYAGAIPTPCPVPNGRRSADERVLSIVQ